MNITVTIFFFRIMVFPDSFYYLTHGWGRSGIHIEEIVRLKNIETETIKECNMINFRFRILHMRKFVFYLSRLRQLKLRP